MIFTAPLNATPAQQRATGHGLTFTSGEYELLASNSSPPAGLRGFIENDLNGECDWAYLFAMGFTSPPATADVEFATHDDDGDLLLIALFIDGESNSRLYIRRRPEGSSSWSSWQDYTPPLGSTGPSGDHALQRDYPFLLITESDLGNNATLAQIIASNPRALRVGDTEAVLAYRDYGVFIPIARTTGVDNNDYFVEYGLRAFSLSPEATAYRASDLSLSGTYPVNSCTGSSLEGEIANVDLGEVFCFNAGQQQGLPPGANWGLAYFYRAPERLTTWNGQLAGDIRSNGSIYIDERMEIAAAHMRVLIPRSARITGLTISLDATAQGLLDYACFSKAVAVMRPSPVAKCSLAHRTRTTRGIDGRVHVVNQSPDPLFRGSFKLNGYGSTAELDDLAALDGLARYACWPSGLDAAYATIDHATAWRRPAFARNCATTRFSGFRGAEGVDVGPMTGSMQFEEVA